MSYFIIPETNNFSFILIMIGSSLVIQLAFLFIKPQPREPLEKSFGATYVEEAKKIY